MTRRRPGPRRRPQPAGSSSQQPVAARGSQNGGHTLEATDTGWLCTVCHTKSPLGPDLAWDKLAPQQCKGSAVVAWATKAHERTQAASTSHRKHTTVKSGPLFWCVTCGAHAESAPVLLTKTCRGKHEGIWVAGGMRDQVKVLRSGRHPKTFQRFPPLPPCEYGLLRTSSRLSRPSAAHPQPDPTSHTRRRRRPNPGVCPPWH